MIFVHNHALSPTVYASIGEFGNAVMVQNRPVVEWMVDVEQAQKWTTTLEEVISTVPFCHRGSLRSLCCELQAMLTKHQKQHEEVVTEAPSPDDLVEYLSAYIKKV